MRVQIIVTRKPRASFVNYSLASMLKAGVEKHDDMLLADTAPDIVHVFGTWDSGTAKLVASIYNRKIPTVYTSLSGLLSLVGNNGKVGHFAQVVHRNKILRTVTVAHVGGPMEEKALKHGFPGKPVCLIPNPCLTKTITEERMFSSMARLYQDTIDAHDKWARGLIDKKVQLVSENGIIHDLCSQILYVKYMMHRGGIPQSLLDCLSVSMTESQYDEDAMAVALKRLGIHDFTSSLLSALSQSSSLTEGFMPIEAADDKLSRKIINSIIQY